MTKENDNGNGMVLKVIISVLLGFCILLIGYVANDLRTRIDTQNQTLTHVLERLARIEGKLEPYEQKGHTP